MKKEQENVTDTILNDDTDVSGNKLMLPACMIPCYTRTSTTVENNTRTGRIEDKTSWTS